MCSQNAQNACHQFPVLLKLLLPGVSACIKHHSLGWESSSETCVLREISKTESMWEGGKVFNNAVPQSF